VRLITKRSEVLERLSPYGQEQKPILCPNAETPEEMEGILLAAQRHAVRNGGRCVVGIGVTATYPDHPQLGKLSLASTPNAGDIAVWAHIWLHWLHGYADRDSLFDGVEVIPFLDHGWSAHDADLTIMHERWFQEAVGIVMFDASSYDFDENVRRTAAYVREAKSRVVVEACPDKVYERGEMLKKHLLESDLLSRPDQVEHFVRETGVDLIVPNLGTEHRAASNEPLEYRRELAQEIARRVGPIQALHGSSSLGGRLGTAGSDGICKINYYTAMAAAATRALRQSWKATPVDGVLPIGQACGGFLHSTRRESISANVGAILTLL
jgi:fructose-bisphosphate aldolase class II